MKPLPFVLLLACLLNTALTHPTGTSIGGQAAGLAHHPDQNTVILGSFPATAVSQSADSPRDSPLEEATEVSFPATAVSPPTDAPLEAATEVSHPDIAPVLPFLGLDILLKIASHAAPKTGHHLGTANKAIRKELNLQWPSLDLKDIAKIKNSRPKLKAFYQAILKKDINAVKVLYPWEYSSDYGLEHIYGLELAARYHSPEAAWILLACGKLAKLTKAEEEEREKHCIDAERQQTETGLALLALISHEKYNSFDREFFRGVILNLQSWAYFRLGLRSGPSKDVRLLGLQLAVQCGTNQNILVLLAFGTCDWDMESEEIKKIIDAAEGRLSQMDLDFLKKIRNSAPEKQHLWKDFVAEFNVHPSIVSDHDTAIVAMQLALMTGRTSTGATLLHKAGPKLKEKLIHAAATLATNADKSDNLQQNWELIEKKVSAM